MEPLVSVPIETAHKLAAVAEPDPALEPDGLRLRIYGQRVCPPLLLQALVDRSDLKFANSLKLVLPNNTAPALRNCTTIKASFEALLPANANDPAVVIILSPVLILSFIKTGIPCMGPLNLPAFLSASIFSAIARASGFTSITLFSPGPLLSISLIRFRYIFVIDFDDCSPEAIFCCSSSMVISSKFKSFINHASS